MPRFDSNATVHGSFARQAYESCSSVAVVEQSVTHSYLDVEQQSNSLARYLIARHVSAGDRVALLVERSAEAVIAMLAVLKVGASFVPLDPAHPSTRIMSILEDASPAAILGYKALLADTSSLSQYLFVDLGEAIGHSRSMSHQPLPETARGSDAAYVMYTSGSTGRPKGVVVPHRAVVRLVHEQSYARFSPDEVFLNLAPLAFDASTFEIWGALLNGAKLGIVRCAQPSVDDIVAAIASYGATTAWFTAGLFHLLVDERVEGLRPLRQILTGGDVVSPAHVRRARQVLPHCRFVNGYGPTENTTFSCCHVIEADDDRPIPIGRPIAHGTAHILDEGLGVVPVGEMGQLCVGGEGLALGYLNAPELTAEKFTYVTSVGERLYLTGDVARCRPDGVYEFFGRIDQQVKIDGKRVEVEEIETVLRGEPDIADAAVLVRADANGQRRLAAFIKPMLPHMATGLAGSIGDRLRRTLPSYMVPSSFRVVGELPLTLNGKIDRARLAALPDAALPLAPELSPAAAAVPRAGLEAAVARVWGDVLGLDDVPRQVNFFDLGGTSLRLMSVHARLASIGRVPLKLVELFDNPTVASLAARLEMGDALVTPVVGDRSTRVESRRAALGRMRERSLEARHERS